MPERMSTPGGSAVQETAEHVDQQETPESPQRQNRAVEREFTVKARTQRQLIVHRFLQHRLATISLVVFVLLILIALVGGRLWHYQYADVSNDFSQPPSVTHPMGTDEIGHDVLAQVLRGARKSVQVALLVAFVSTAVGTVVGAVSGLRTTTAARRRCIRPDVGRDRSRVLDLARRPLLLAAELCRAGADVVVGGAAPAAAIGARLEGTTPVPRPATPRSGCPGSGHWPWPASTEPWDRGRSV